MTAVICNKCFGSLLEKKVQVHAEGRRGAGVPPESLGNGATREGPRIPLEPAIPSPDTDARYSLEQLLVPHLAVPPRSAASMPHVAPAEPTIAESEPREVDPENPYGLDEVTESALVSEAEAPTEVHEGSDRQRAASTVREEIFGHPPEPAFAAEPAGFLRRQRTVVAVGAVALAAAALAAYMVHRGDTAEVRSGQSAEPAAQEGAPGQGRAGAGSLAEPRAAEPSAPGMAKEAAPVQATETRAAPTAATPEAAAMPAQATPVSPPPVAATPAPPPPAATSPPTASPPRPAARPSRRTASESGRTPAENSGALEPIGGSVPAAQPRPVRAGPIPEPPPPPAPAPVAGPCTSTVAALGLCTPPGAGRP